MTTTETTTRPRHPNCRKLHAGIRNVIVDLLGQYVSERKVMLAVRESFGIELSPSAIHWYAVSSVWSPKLRAKRQEFAQRLEANHRLAARAARVRDLCEAAEQHAELRDGFRRQHAAALAERARYGDRLDELSVHLRELSELEVAEERAWLRCIGQIRAEMGDDLGIDTSMGDAAEAAEFIRQMGRRLAREGANDGNSERAAAGAGEGTSRDHGPYGKNRR